MKIASMWVRCRGLHGRVGQAGRQAVRYRNHQNKTKGILDPERFSGGRRARQELLPGKAGLAETDQ